MCDFFFVDFILVDENGKFWLRFFEDGSVLFMGLVGFKEVGGMCISGWVLELLEFCFVFVGLEVVEVDVVGEGVVGEVVIDLGVKKCEMICCCFIFFVL